MTNYFTEESQFRLTVSTSCCTPKKSAPPKALLRIAVGHRWAISSQFTHSKVMYFTSIYMDHNNPCTH